MEKLRETLGLQWTYVNALESTNDLSHKIWEWVLRIRTGEPRILNEADPSSTNPPPGRMSFAWPDDIDRLELSRAPIDLWSRTIWSTPAGTINSTPYHPIACATRDFNVANSTLGLPDHLILTRARIACWHSHMTVIQSIANKADPFLDGAYMILEDDIDMERNIISESMSLWDSLPKSWDIIFLGHCWSNETKTAPLPLRSPDSSPESSEDGLRFIADIQHLGKHRLYLSSSPKCSHAYVLSKRGARRLLLHLRYPPFAYSRAIDQAFSWLVQSGRLKSYTVVPSLVIQRKDDNSDISPGLGSKWREVLMDGVLSDRKSVV